MGRLVRAIIFAIVAAALAGVVVFFGGFALAKVLKVSDASGWGALVPMVFTPLAMLAGAALGAWKGYSQS
jgi:membrane protein DedA with SNARE-associated domain